MFIIILFLFVGKDIIFFSGKLNYPFFFALYTYLKIHLLYIEIRFKRPTQWLNGSNVRGKISYYQMQVYSHHMQDLHLMQDFA